MTSLSRQPGDDINLRSRAQMLEYAAIADRIATSTKGPVLDWGCGKGQLIDLLSRRGVDVEGLEHDPGVTTEGPATLDHFPDFTAYLTSDPVALPYADDSFELVLSCGVLEHVADPKASLSEVRRVLRPGGLFLVYKLPNRFSYLERVARQLGGYYHGAWEHDQVYTRQTAEKLVTGAGFLVGGVRLANMLPLTIPGRLGDRLGPSIWTANRILGRIPGLNLIATNVELTARLPA